MTTTPSNTHHARCDQCSTFAYGPTLADAFALITHKLKAHANDPVQCNKCGQTDGLHACPPEAEGTMRTQMEYWRAHARRWRRSYASTLKTNDALVALLHESLRKQQNLASRLRAAEDALADLTPPF